jgi:two-component system invasion response regulator UvrY
MIGARPQSNESVRILIVDDHPIVVSGCRALLADNPNIVIAVAADAAAGEASFVAERPDACVVDINLPGVSGFRLARRILRRDATAEFIIFSMNDHPIFAACAIEAGARGYVSKSGDPGDLIDAIHEVVAGRSFLPPAIAQKLAFAGPGW